MLSELSALPGDMNNDGILNALDASEILKYSVGISAGANLAAADLNGDGTVNASDAGGCPQNGSRIINASWIF